MSLPDRESWTEEESLAEFSALFPQGVAGADVLAEIAPEGWEASPLMATFHPTVEQVLEESLRMHRNISELGAARRKPDAPPLPPEPTLESISEGWESTPINARQECAQLVGECLWDLFSDNHEVVGPDGRVLDIGSFRGAAGFIYEFVKGEIPPIPEMDNMMSEFMPAETKASLEAMGMKFDMNYLQFYMGTIRTRQRADLGPVYRMIFRRLLARDHDWIYHFPRLFVADLRPLRNAMAEDSGKPEWETYNPSGAFAQEAEDEQKDREIDEMRESLDEGYRESVEASRSQPAPATVLAYREIFGREPDGWPPPLEV